MDSRKPRHPFKPLLILLMVLTALAFTSSLAVAALPAVDDFEAGLPSGKDANGVSIGFVTFQDSNPATTVAISTTDALPAAVPGASSPNHVLKMD